MFFLNSNSQHVKEMFLLALKKKDPVVLGILILMLPLCEFFRDKIDFWFFKGKDLDQEADLFTAMEKNERKNQNYFKFNLDFFKRYEDHQMIKRHLDIIKLAR